MSDETANDLEDEDHRKVTDLELLRVHANQLSEQFDTVQIIATRHVSPKDGTIHAAHGSGNWYARYGSVMAWLQSENGKIGRQGDS